MRDQEYSLHMNNFISVHEQVQRSTEINYIILFDWEMTDIIVVCAFASLFDSCYSPIISLHVTITNARSRIFLARDYFYICAQIVTCFAAIRCIYYVDHPRIKSNQCLASPYE